MLQLKKAVSLGRIIYRWNDAVMNPCAILLLHQAASAKVPLYGKNSFRIVHEQYGKHGGRGPGLSGNRGESMAGICSLLEM